MYSIIEDIIRSYNYVIVSFTTLLQDNREKNPFLQKKETIDRSPKMITYGLLYSSSVSM